MDGPASRRRTAILAGHTGDEATARALLGDGDAQVRAAALSALARLGRARPDEVGRALVDADPVVRRRACQVAATVAVDDDDLVARLADDDPGVAEASAWALGERGGGRAPGVVRALAAMASAHPDPQCREAAVAALGAIGDASGLPAVLAATADRPAVRRRAVIALAPFDGPEVDAALERARQDRDWQVRQAAEDLS